MYSMSAFHALKSTNSRANFDSYFDVTPPSSPIQIKLRKHASKLSQRLSSLNFKTSKAKYGTSNAGSSISHSCSGSSSGSGEVRYSEEERAKFTISKWQKAPDSEPQNCVGEMRYVTDLTIITSEQSTSRIERVEEDIKTPKFEYRGGSSQEVRASLVATRTNSIRSTRSRTISHVSIDVTINQGIETKSHRRTVSFRDENDAQISGRLNLESPISRETSVYRGHIQSPYRPSISSKSSQSRSERRVTFIPQSPGPPPQIPLPKLPTGRSSMSPSIKKSKTIISYRPKPPTAPPNMPSRTRDHTRVVNTSPPRSYTPTRIPQPPPFPSVIASRFTVQDYLYAVLSYHQMPITPPTLIHHLTTSGRDLWVMASALSLISTGTKSEIEYGLSATMEFVSELVRSGLNARQVEVIHGEIVAAGEILGHEYTGDRESRERSTVLRELRRRESAGILSSGSTPTLGNRSGQGVYQWIQAAKAPPFLSPTRSLQTMKVSASRSTSEESVEPKFCVVTNLEPEKKNDKSTTHLSELPKRACRSAKMFVRKIRKMRVRIQCYESNRK